MEDYTYGNLVESISDEFNRQLLSMSAEYNFDYGDEFEIAVCEALRRILPRKYGVCRGFVVDKLGNVAGDDIVVYDADSFPSLRFLGNGGEFARKAKIPVDAVYAYIEAKHSLTSETLARAIEQVIRVKRLCYTRNHVLRADVASCVVEVLDKSPTHVFDNSYSAAHGWDPIVTTPVYGMVLSRYCSPRLRENAQTGKDVVDFLAERLNGDLRRSILAGGIYCPESIVVNNSANAICGHYRFDSDGNLERGINITRFYTGIGNLACYQVNAHGSASLGIAIAHMLWSLDYIRLGKMPWGEVFNTAKIPDQEMRSRFLSSL